MIGHILPGITPANVGEIKATDIVAAVDLFNAKYLPGG